MRKFYILSILGAFFALSIVPCVFSQNTIKTFRKKNREQSEALSKSLDKQIQESLELAEQEANIEMEQIKRDAAAKNQQIQSMVNQAQREADRAMAEARQAAEQTKREQKRLVEQTSQALGQIERQADTQRAARRVRHNQMREGKKPAYLIGPEPASASQEQTFPTSDPPLERLREEETQRELEKAKRAAKMQQIAEEKQRQEAEKRAREAEARRKIAALPSSIGTSAKQKTTRPLALTPVVNIKKLTTIDGRFFEEVHIVRREPDRIIFVHSKGGASINLREITEDSREIFNYDPKKASEYRSNLRQIQSIESTGQTIIWRLSQSVTSEIALGHMDVSGVQKQICVVGPFADDLINNQLYRDKVYPAGHYTFTFLDNTQRIVPMFALTPQRAHDFISGNRPKKGPAPH